MLDRAVTLLDIIENLSGSVHQFPFVTRRGPIELNRAGVLVVHPQGPPLGVRTPDIRRIQDLLKRGGVLAATPEVRPAEPEQWTVDVYPKAPDGQEVVRRPEFVRVHEVLYRKKESAATSG